MNGLIIRLDSDRCFNTVQSWSASILYGDSIVEAAQNAKLASRNREVHAAYLHTSRCADVIHSRLLSSGDSEDRVVRALSQSNFVHFTTSTRWSRVMKSDSVHADKPFIIFNSGWEHWRDQVWLAIVVQPYPQKEIHTLKAASFC